ncbi:MAG: V-type ATP synthase subunit E [Tissierellia bacterium]|nr:V-type ATP synthase subunit E [Tissierellia bacterium]
MSNLENITQKILEDAKNKVKEIELNAKTEAENLIQSREEEANRVKETILKRAEAEAAQAKEKIISGATLKARDLQLMAKQTVMDRVFDLAKEALKSLGEGEYAGFAEKVIAGLKLKGNELIIPQEGRAEALKARFPKLNISSTDTVDSGFAILDGKTLLNYNFNDLVDFNRLELEGEIAERLFKTKE